MGEGEHRKNLGPREKREGEERLADGKKRDRRGKEEAKNRSRAFCEFALLDRR